MRGFDNADEDCADEMDWFYEPTDDDYAEMMAAFSGMDSDMSERRDHIWN